MEKLLVDLPDDASEIAFLGDVHYGHPGLSETHLNQAIEQIIERKQYTVLMGDLMEGREPSHKFYIPGSPTLQEQKKWVIKSFKPLVDEGLLLGALAGNHENSSKDKMTLDALDDICAMWDVPCLGDMAFVRLNHQKHDYKMIVAHGAGGSTTLTGTITKLRNFAKEHPVDAVVWGHTHKLLHVPEPYMVYDRDGNQTHVRRKIAFAGTFLKSYEYGKSGYAERNAMGMTSIGYLFAFLDNGILRFMDYEY